MPINSGGLIIDDDEIKKILGDKELTIILLNRFLQEVQGALIKARENNMKLTKLPDGSIKLEPEGNELEILQWVESKLGETALRDQIQQFIEQRKAQKDYDELMEVGKELKEMEPEERADIIQNIRTKANIAKDRKVKDNG